jgi:hypothetical protein
MEADVQGMLAEAVALPDTPPVKWEPVKLRYSHKAMADMLIAEPWLRQNDIAARFGRTASWISTIMASDAFQAYLETRSDEILDPVMRMKAKERFEGLLLRSIEILEQKLSKPSIDQIPDQLALRTLELTSRAAGYGARDTTTVNVNVTQQIDDAGDQLVHLLRRKKAEVLEGEFSDEQK